MLEKGRPRGLFLSDRFCGPTAYVIREDAAFGFIEPLPSPAEGPRFRLVRALFSLGVTGVFARRAR